MVETERGAAIDAHRPVVGVASTIGPESMEVSTSMGSVRFDIDVGSQAVGTRYGFPGWGERCSCTANHFKPLFENTMVSRS